MFTHLFGNEQVKKYLTRMVETDAIGNSLLFAGPEGIGKSLFAYAFAKALICSDDPQGKHKQKIESGNHPDIRIYRPEGKIGMHSIASLRQLSEEVYLAPYEAKRKIFIIHDAERMLPYSSNALLKTFEEPLPVSIMILISSYPDLLLPTVRSRCRAIYFSALSEQEKALLPLNKKQNQELRISLLNTLANGSLSTYKQLSELCADLASQIEQSKMQVEEEERNHFLRGVSAQDLTAIQKQVLEKEIEGAVSMRTSTEAHALLEIILGWYRDLHLLLVNGNRKLLIHPGFVSECEQSLQRGEILPLEMVQKAIADARLSLERSTSLNICLESLFLKLNLLK